MNLFVSITRSPEETEKAGEVLGRALEIGDVVLLIGELGAGKTAFSRGVARGLGVRDRVTSPTFVLVRNYQGSKELVHADLYRLGDGALFDLQMLELGMPDVVTVIEWGDRAAGSFEYLRPLTIRFIPQNNPDVRVLRYEGDPDAWSLRLSRAGLEIRTLDWPLPEN